jgi:predicted transcriptional regulator
VKGSDSIVPEFPDDRQDSNVSNMGRFLFGSDSRIELLGEVEGGTRYSKLTDRYSDSLVSSTVTDFRDKGIAIKDEDDFVRLTPLGEFIIEEYGELVHVLQQGGRVKSFFNAISSDACELVDSDIISGGVTKSGSPVDKNAVLREYVSHITEANEVKEIVPTLIRAGIQAPEGKSVYNQQILNNEIKCEFVHTSEIVNVISNKESYRQEEARKHQKTDTVTYYEYSGSFPFTLTIYDNSFVTCITDNKDGVKVMFENDSEDCVDWACSLFEEYREKSTEFSY